MAKRLISTLLSKANRYWLALVAIGIATGSIYLSNQAETIYGGDAGDLASAVVTTGIPHPPGYPLYTILGVLVSKQAEVGTLAWRLGFLSTIPAILTLLFLFDLICYLTGKTFLSLISALILAFAYPFWLYAETVEVFSLNNFFIVILLWLVFHFKKSRKVKYLYLASFFLGLSLSHHHIILFLTPSLAYLLLKRKEILLKIKVVAKSALLFFLGLLPYLYLPIAAKYNPEVNWMGPPSLISFLNQVLRVGYGTFQAGSFIAHQPVLRLLDVFAFIDFVNKDLRLLGIILFLLGAIYLLRRNRTIFLTLLIAFLSYTFFLFYASFPLVENFLVGTYERFLLPLYIVIILFLTFGILLVEQVFEKVVFGFLPEKKKSLVVNLAMVLFLIYPLSLFKLNFQKISILKKDFTAENLGRDILNTVPENSVLLLSTDTSLFNTQYVYYSQRKWPTVKLIHFSKLYMPYYFEQLGKHYPDLVLPDPDLSDDEKFISFINLNYDKFPIFTKQSFSQNQIAFLPYGLLFRYLKNDDLPSEAEVVDENEKLWSFYQDPLSGSLSVFENLMLSDVLKIYSFGRQEIAFFAANHGYLDRAEKHLIEAKRLYPHDKDIYKISAQVYIKQKKCRKAQEEIEKIKEIDSDDESYYLFLAINSSSCQEDEEKAEYYQKFYQEMMKKKETPLRQL